MENIEVRIQRIEDRQTDHTRRIENIERVMEQQNKLIYSVEQLAKNMDGMVQEQKNQGQRLTALETNPLKRMNDRTQLFINGIISAMATVAAGAIIWLIYFIITNK